MGFQWLSVVVVAVVTCCCLQGLSNAAVISIDFGSEWIKVALVKVSSMSGAEHGSVKD